MLSSYRRFKKNTPLRRMATPTLVRAIKRIENGVFAVNRAMTKVEHRSKYNAICHIGLQKTGTVWFREMMADPLLYRYSGLKFVDCAGKREGLMIQDGGIYAPIRQISDEIIEQISRPEVATLFVVRNPLAITLSWINSTEKYHITGRGDQNMSERRAALLERDFSGKIAYAMEYFRSEERFEKIERLLALADRDDTITVARYEDGTNSANETFARIFDALDIRMPEDVRASFITRHSFEAYSGRSLNAEASAESALQGRTHLAIQKMPEKDRDLVRSFVGPHLRKLYEA